MAEEEISPGRPRPRPQYGEYASPQDQAAAIATSLPALAPVLTPADRPSSVTPASALGSTPASLSAPESAPASEPAPASAPDPAAQTPGPPPSRQGRSRGSDSHSSASTLAQGGGQGRGQGRRWDVVVSVGLMIYGFLNMVSGFFQYADLGAYLDELYGTFGIGNYVEKGMERPIGIAIVAVNLISFTLVAWFTVRALRGGRIGFWIPLVGGLVATVASTIFLQILLADDPALATYLDGLLRR